MRIIQVIQKPQFRGAELFACLLSSHLLREGHDVLMVCLFKGDVQIPFEGNISYLNLSKKNRFWDIKGWYQIAKIVRRSKAEIVQANAADTLKYTVFSKIFFRWSTPIVYRNASVVSEYIKTSWGRVLNRMLYRNVNFVVSVSDDTQQDLASIFPFVDRKSSVIPVAVPSYLGKRQLANREGPIVIHVGGFSFEKNHALLLSVFSKLLLKHPQASLWLVGEGELRKEVEKLAIQMGLEGNTRFLGNRRDIYELLSQADVLILTSIIEGLPSVILEGFMCKIPVVASDVGGISEVVIDNETGWLIKSEQGEEYVNAIEDVISNSDRAKRITENAYELVVSHYEISRIASQFIDVFRRLTKVT